MDSLPLTVHRRRIYILPSRFGIALALLLSAMLAAGLNYNSNLGLAFGFLMMSLALVAMHHCHRNLLGLGVDAQCEADGFADGHARFTFVLRNVAKAARSDIEIRCGGAATLVSVAGEGYVQAFLDLPTARRGILRLPRFELRTRHPFGWFRAWTYAECPLTAWVAPRAAGRRAPLGAATPGSPGHSDASGDEDFAGLRDYQSGMPLKHMAWKVVARGGDPVVQTHTGAGADPEWLDFHSLKGLDVEERLSQLCRWVLDGDSAGRPYGLVTPEVRIPPGRGAVHRIACLRALAGFGLMGDGG